MARHRFTEADRRKAAAARKRKARKRPSRKRGKRRGR